MISVPEFQPYPLRHVCLNCTYSLAGRCSTACITYGTDYEPKRLAA